MENAGLITYRESVMLYDVNDHYDAQMTLISLYMSHELAHQWFGNLVTPMWWNYLWLKEGMATLFGYSITDLVCKFNNFHCKLMVCFEHFEFQVHPEWNMTEHFIIGRMLGSMVNESSSKSTQPMSYYSENPSDLKIIIVPVIYEKCKIIFIIHKA